MNDHSSTAGGTPGAAPYRTRTRHDHNHFAARRRANMKPGESLAEARRRWKAEDRCRDCGGLFYEDGATGARCAACRRGAGRRKQDKCDGGRPMNRARAALCGLALGASGAAADDDDLAALFVRCVGSLIETYSALAAECPDRYGGFKGEAFLLRLRAMQEKPKATIRTSSKGPFQAVQELCATADVFPAALEAARRNGCEGGAQ